MVEGNHNLIYSFLNSHKLSVDEWYDVAAIGLCKAGLTYMPDKGYRFSSYAYRVMTNEVRAEMRKLNSERLITGKESVSYDAFMRVDDKGKLTFMDTLENVYHNTENEAIVNITFSNFMENIKNEKEIKIIKLLANGYKQEEAAKIMGCSQAAVSRVKKRFIKLFDKSV